MDYYEYDLNQSGTYTNIGDVLAHTFATPFENGPFFFQVRAVVKAGNVSPAPFIFFVIDSTAKPAPRDLTIDPESPTNDNTPTFSWSFVEGAVSYEITLDTDEPIDIGETNEYTVPTPLPDGDHRFEVRAVDSEGKSPPAGLEFIVDTVAPSAPGKPNLTTRATDSTPTFTWTEATDATSGIDYYEYDFDQTGTYTPIGDVLSYTFETPIAPGTYPLTVRAVDKAGNVGPPAFTVFTLEEPPPAPWDVNEDGVVTTEDLNIVADAIGTSPPSRPRADVNGDGVVDILDLAEVASHLGETV